MLESGALPANGAKLSLLLHLLPLPASTIPTINIKSEAIIPILCCPPHLLWKNNNKQSKPLSFSMLLVLLYIFSSTGTEVISTTVRS